MILLGIAATSPFTTHVFLTITRALSLALVPIYFGFGCLTVAWLLVAVGMRRTVR